MIQHLSPSHAPQVIDVRDEKNIASIADIRIAVGDSGKISIAITLGRNKEK